ncbi:MAG TPA: phosphoenolpyruvate carboxykinase (GTP) [Candidatus Polarisedimenticolia bacterium]|jgi:phosphoenolpyruvate carboxykinase (GTP)|nr:phosphoenolpyruvate carboxykinase (GTP) [Candidatus Polarisedimenticolia bacterium]
MPNNRAVEAWVAECERITTPKSVVWCDGSDEERARLTRIALEVGDLLPMNNERLPGCSLHRSAVNDVARVEKLTFICSDKKEDAGPTNNWMAPKEAYEKLGGIFKGSMKGRTMYVVPFLMGPKGSPFSKVGVEVTDSVYVALNMGLMTRMGSVALEHLGGSDDFTKGFHSKADLDVNRRFICHFPQDNTIWSVGSGYGGNALLSKKCMALRLASVLGSKEGWLAEHMLIVGIQDPQGRTTYVCGAFPSACGKTNLAMLVPPDRFPGWKVFTVGDDIAWLRPGPDGRLWAINPEAGFFGVAPGTSRNSNPNALAMLRKDAIFTNVALKEDGTYWWEGLEAAPLHCTDWKGQPWTPASKEPAAHPNARFTVGIRQAPSFTEEWNNPQGVPISAILFGARRANVVPLVYEAMSWQHGTYLGATMASETTAAATGAVGVVRRDPFAMLPFCGYNMADYFRHWLDVGAKLSNPPKIFRVNWFNRDDNGKFIWPGFGDNLRVLQWVIGRCDGKAKAVTTPIGLMPTKDAIDTEGLKLAPGAMDRLLEVDDDGWARALRGQDEFFDQFGGRIPQELRQENEALGQRLKSAR